MPAMPRAKKAQKISDRVMKKDSSDRKEDATRMSRPGREPLLVKDVRTMIKR